jgi:transcriptional regulator with XRE-family HTH domain
VNVPAIGAYIREQREQAKISLRQLAQAAGVSNPYLSQIERGLRRPSADILQQIAKGLRISAEALYVQAGFLEDKSSGSVVRDAVLTDPELNERQKQMLIEIYESFRKESVTVQAGAASDDDEAALAWPGTLEPAGLARWAIAADPEHTADAGPAAAGEPASARAVAGEPEQDSGRVAAPEPRLAAQPANARDGDAEAAAAGPWADSDAAAAGPWADSDAAAGPWADSDAAAGPWAEAEAAPWTEADADGSAAGANNEPDTGSGARTGAADFDGRADSEGETRGATIHQFPSASGSR